MPTQVCGYRLHQPVHKRRRVGWAEAACGGCVKVDAGLYRWRWLQLLQRLDPLSNLKPSLLHVSVYFLNRLLSIGAVLFT
jgi:hypothetical protein